MELEIANYLNQVSEGRLSSESKLQIRAMLREVTEIESIGDSCYNLARTISRKAESNPEHSLKIFLMIGYALCVELEKKISNRIMTKRFINDER